MARGGNSSTAHVIITMEGKQAIDFMKKLQEQAQKTRQELEGMENAGMQDTEDYRKKVNELKTMQRAIQQNKAAYIDLADILKNLDNTSLSKLQKALKEVRKQMYALDPERLAKEGRSYRAELAKLQAQYQAIDNQIGQVTGQWKRQDGAIMSVIKRLTAYVSVYGGFNFVTGQLSKVFNKNLEFSDQLSDIRKTTGLSKTAIDELSESIGKIDTRSSVQELHNLAYEAGRLGIGSQGADAVLGFVRAADKLNVALNEDLGEEAIVQLTKMADVMGIVKKMGVEKALLSIGSAINELSQNSTASGQFIADYVQRLSGIAVQSHLNVEELLAFGAAADATGQEVEVSATAMNKFIVQLQTHYKTVAQAAGISEEALHQMLAMGNTADAVVAVLESLGRKGGLSVLAPLMKDMGSDGARLTASLSTMASNIGLVKQQLDISREAFMDNISVTNEFNIKNETAAAIMDRMKNSWEKMFVNSANEGAIRDFAQDMYDLSNSITRFDYFATALRLTLGALVTMIKTLLTMAPALSLFFSIKGIVLLAGTIRNSLIPMLGNLVKSLFTVTASANGASAATATFGVRLRALGAILKSNVFVLAASVIATIAFKLSELSGEMSDSERVLESLNDGLSKFKNTSHSAGIEANILFSRLKEAADGTKERRDLIRQINNQYGHYLPNLISEKSSLEEIAGAQETVNRKLRQSLALKAKNTAMDELSQTYTPKMAAATGEMQEIYTKAGIGKVGENDVNFLVEQTQKYYDAGMKYAEIREKVWDELYRVGPEGQPGGRSSSLVKHGGVLSGEWRDLRSMVEKYVSNFWNQNLAAKRVSGTYDPLIGDYTEPDDSGAPYKIVEQEKDSDRKRRDREELKYARDQHKAVMSALEVYYKQQEQVINDAYLKQQITVAQREQEIADIEARHLKSRIAARAALHDDPGALEEWDKELARMHDENLSKTEESNRSLVNLMQKDLSSIGEQLRKFGEAEDDAIWKNLEADRTKLQEQAIGLREEIESIIRKYDFTGQVTEKFIAAMQKLDIFFPSMKDEMGVQIADMQEAARNGMKDLYGIYPKLFDIDIDTGKGVEEFKKMLFGLRGLSDEYVHQSEENIRLLYYKTLEYGDAMTEAEEKAKKRQSDIANAQYRRTGMFKGNENAVNTAGETVGVYKSAQSLGLASDIMVKDSEVEMYEARLKAAMDYYEYLKSTGRDTQEAELKLQEATAELSSAMVERMKEQFDQLRNYGKNVEDFGKDFGEALFAGLDDRQKALENFVRAVGESTKEMILNWVKQKVEHAILRKAMVQVERESQEEMADANREGESDVSKELKKGARAELKRIAKSGLDRLKIKRKSAKDEKDLASEEQAAEKTIAEEGAVQVSNALISIGAQTVAAKKQQAVENVSTGSAETQANVSMGIAGGAAKTIAELGWWGIPLVAVITALLNALLGAAMSKVSSLFGGSSGGKTGNAKLVTGMLTYDSGNVQSVLGDNGKIYNARTGNVGGSGLVVSPLLTNVGGRPALVGEEGPELVIGRRTTRALMQDSSGLLEGLIRFDKMHSGLGFRRYASGNLQEYGSSLPFQQQDGRDSRDREQAQVLASVMEALQPVLKGVNDALTANRKATSALNERLSYPIHATINKNGKGGLIDEVAKGLDEERRLGRSDSVRRLFGGRSRG